MKNIAYIDGQNLYMGTMKITSRWKIDLFRFHVYLQEKYNVGKAYYYLGYVQDGSNFEKILFPNKKFASSLYKKLGAKYFSALTDAGIRKKIETKEKGSLGN